MKLKLLFFAFLSICAKCSFGQKPTIDSSAYDKWLSVQSITISNDGEFCQYSMRNQPISDNTRVLRSTASDVLVVRSTARDWKLAIPGVPPDECYFTGNSKMAIFLNAHDSLGLIRLEGDSIEYISQVNSFKLNQTAGIQWLAYKLNTPVGRIVLRNLGDGSTRTIDSVDQYFFSGDGSSLVVETNERAGDKSTESVLWLRLKDDALSTIWQGMNMDNLVYAKNDPRIAFLVSRGDNDIGQKELWYYRDGEDKAVKIASGESPELEGQFHINSIAQFSEDGKDLYFSLAEEVDKRKADPTAVRVDVWSYKDSKLQSQQLAEKDNFPTYLTLIHLDDHRIIRLEHENETASFGAGGYALIDRMKGDATNGEANWNPSTRHSVFLESTVDGRRTTIKNDMSSFLVFTLSPAGKYVIYYDKTVKNWFCRSNSSGITRNLTAIIPTIWSIDNEQPYATYLTEPIAGWLKDDKAVLLQDQNDIWELDPEGKTPPISLTNGYGRAHDIVFHLTLDDPGLIVDTASSILLTAFNRQTKENGFYSKVLGRNGNPELLTMGSFLYDIPGDPGVPDGVNFTPVKARDAAAYIVSRMTATESPNYFFTRDFKRFNMLSEVHPEKDWNWYTTELVKWKTPDERMTQGILYKPENFDPKRKYPLIIYYYERLSEGLNAYLKPEPSYGWLNITWYVSNGYLVFTPDIHFRVGETGKSALNSVVSAASYLSKFPYVDAKRMGIQGMSFGGYETNYIVTHTHLFAAACSASGVFDMVSGYGAVDLKTGQSAEPFYELSAFRMGHTPWERPDQYIESSPIFRADLVTTPFLMMHTKKDADCQFVNAEEFFTALRRLGKKAWMLQYDDGDHGLTGAPALDFTLRMGQFFDHYLKGSPAPKWMTLGIPAKMKGIENGLELDLSSVSP